MTHANAHEARRWLDQAREDLATAQVLLDGERFYMVCFVAHQTVEKALKAYLFSVGEEAVVGHGIHRLATRAAEHDAEFLTLRERISILDTYYIPTRYPNGLPDGIPADAYNRQAAEEAFGLSQAALDFATSRMT
jgi:HEPN domain-containing protein